MPVQARFRDLLLACDMDRNYSPIYDFMQVESRRMFFKKNKREMIEIIPEVIKHTYRNNINWLNNEKIQSLPGFIEAFKEGIYDIDPYKRGLFYGDFLLRINNPEVYDEELIDFFSKTELKPQDVLILIKDMCQENIKMASLFLSKIDLNVGPKMTMEIVDAINSGCRMGLSKSTAPLDENIETFMNNVDNLYTLYTKVEYEETKKKVMQRITDNIDEVIDKVGKYQVIGVIKHCQGEAREKAIKYAKDHFEEIVNAYPTNSLFDSLIKDFETIPELEQMRANYVNNNFDKLIEAVYYAMNDYDKEEVEKLQKNPDRDIIIDILKMVFKEVSENENVKFSDIKRIGRGGYTDVYQVGEKVIKVGRGRGQERFPNNPYIITPLLRKDFGFYSGKRYENAYIEVTERADILTDEEVSEEELYMLYSRMREIGLEWMDIEARNVGLLRRDNRIYWNEEINPSDEVLGLAPKVGAGVHLKKGDLVIIDADFIFEEGSIPDSFFNCFEDDEFTFMQTWTYYHERYNSEHYSKTTKSK